MSAQPGLMHKAPRAALRLVEKGERNAAMAGEIMRILIAIDIGQARNWHAALGEALRRDGHDVAFGFAAGPPQDKAVARLLAFEQLAYRVGPQHSFASAALAEGPGLACDLVIDLAAAPLPGASRLVPHYDGQPGTAAALACVLSGQSPQVAIAWQRAAEPAATMASGTPGIERPDVAMLALGFLMTRTASLLRQAVARIGRGDAPLAAPAARIAPVAAAPAAFAARQLTDKVARRLAGLVRRQGHWRVGWRRCADDGVTKTLAWPGDGYQTLADDGRRYYADPFLFEHQGQLHLFVEEFPYATGKGVISSAIIGADGRIGVPQIVLERPWHLSYPQVFAQGEAIYMIPETGANRSIELYRAITFPHRWIREAVLVENVVAGDATYLQHGGRHWLFASITEEGGSTWDQLGLFHAPSLRGPWQPHAANPVLTDAGCARPAGQMRLIDGKIRRVAQDCLGGYGRGLSLATIDRLDTQGYAQTVQARLAPAWGMQAVHSLNLAGGAEVVDYFG